MPDPDPDVPQTPDEPVTAPAPGSTVDRGPTPAGGQEAEPGGAPARAVADAKATVPKPGGPPPALVDAIGGPLGVAESAVPAALFVAIYTLGGQDTSLAAIVAVAVGAALTLARLVRGQTLQFAISGLVGIALAGFIVSRTGRAEDFFLPGILINIAYATAYFVSILVRWPLMGVLIATVTTQGTEWRQDPDMMRAYTRASWVWVVLFATRLAVQLPLYFAGALVALGTAKVAMGIPLFVLGLWLTWLCVRRVTPQEPLAG